jgi:pimeloyl-ACP methyl ester carboxylesterase
VNGAAILATVRRKHGLLRPAWLSHVGHLRPGIGKGLPLEQAEAQAVALDAEARRLARSKEVEFPNRSGEWNGFPKHELQIAGKAVTVVAPKAVAPGRPWVWHGEFFGHKPAPDVALLEKGFHAVYVKVPDMLGSPAAVAAWDQVYAELTGAYKLGAKPALVGLSRGGLYCYSWAIANPGKVACIYADAPVCDFKSWPGGKGKGKGDPANWARVLKLWGFKDEAEALAYPGNPVDRLEPLAKAGVPLLHVFGDADDVVPWEENTGLVDTRYRALGGSITLLRKPGVGHHPHGLDDPAPIVEFILKHAR